jgi:hypothetical protein
VRDLGDVLALIVVLAAAIYGQVAGGWDGLRYTAAQPGC